MPTGAHAVTQVQALRVRPRARQVLWDHHRLIYSSFAYYASLGTSDDIYHIYLNSFLALVDDCRLAIPRSKRCQRKVLPCIRGHTSETPPITSEARCVLNQHLP